ncbi:tripartite tricarboxylate transporter substrate-binding protein [Treponema zioleckii]|uniref:tripartite tricarboxylate transporter substrate-binding protein n=1 Tax=Treponema zioleckii TaxID=331680 RepID=UPI00168AF2A7|nr:tripartite tricarboxylate transporter substrate-binding protein [Treponema zioleckii]
MKKAIFKTLGIAVLFLGAIASFVGWKRVETVKIICPYGVGGTADAIARKYAEVANKLQSDYNFVVEQKTGGDGFAAAQFFSEEKSSKKDLLIYGYGVAYRHDLGKKYKTEIVDFDRSKIYPIASVDDRTWILYALPNQSLAAILNKARNGGIKMSGGNPLSDPHLALGSLIAQEGGTVRVVPYDGGAAQKKGLLDKEVDVFVGSTQVAQQEVEAGTLVPILAFSDRPFNGFVTPTGKISVPTIAGVSKAPELNATNDYSGSILAAGGFIATHTGAKQAWIDTVAKISKDVWASPEYSDWINSILLNNFQVYDKDASKYLEAASKKAVAAYAKLK